MKKKQEGCGYAWSMSWKRTRGNRCGGKKKRE